MSTGLLWLQIDGSRALNAAMLSGEISASSPPPCARASVASTPGPPALVTMQSFLPFGSGCFESASIMSKMSSMPSTRSTPTRRKAASSTSSEPVSEPVWEAAALAAAAVRPALITMIGFSSETRRAAERKRFGSPMLSI